MMRCRRMWWVLPPDPQLVADYDAIEEFQHNSVDTPAAIALLSAVEVDRMVKKTKQQVVPEPESDSAKKVEKKRADLPPDYRIVVGLAKSRIDVIAERVADISAKMSEMKEELKDLQAEGASILIKAGVKSVMVDNFRTTQTSGRSPSQIKRDLLLKFGVKEAVIEKSTVEGKPWTSLKVTDVSKPREGDGGEDE